MSKDLPFFADWFGFSGRPFGITPDANNIFWSSSHQSAYAMIEYGLINAAPVVVVAGPVGTGKTSLLHHALERLSDELTVGLISNYQHGRDELLRWALRALGLPSAAGDSHLDLYDAFETELLRLYAEGRRTVLVFDEAQFLSPAALQELRLLTNINQGGDTLLQLVLSGQPDLLDMIQDPGMTALAQRVTAVARLKPMNLIETNGYIDYRLAAVDGQPSVYTPEARQMIWEVSRGVPRLINQVCDMALVYAFSGESEEVLPAHVAAILEDRAIIALNPPQAPRDEPRHSMTPSGQGR